MTNADSAPDVDNVRGAAWMLGAAVCGSAATIMIKKVSGHLPAAEVAFIRSACGIITLAPLVMRYGWRVFRTRRPDLHVIRILCSSLGLVLGVYAVTQLHLATVVSLSYTRPLFMIILAYFLLHEKVHWRRGLATIMGFVGVLVVMGPSDVSSLPGAFAALSSAALVAGTMVVVRRQAAEDGPATIMVWAMTGLFIATAIPAALTWQTPQVSDLGLLALLSTFGSAAQYMIIRAFTLGEATVVNPVDYSQILFTSAVGYFFFAETPTIWTVTGAIIIVASTLYIVLREAKLRKEIVASNAAPRDMGDTPSP